MRTADAAMAIGLGTAAVGMCAALAASTTGGGRLEQRIDRRAGTTGAQRTASSDAASELRCCRRCDVSKGRECFTAKQWERADSTKRTCNPCCAALDAERIAREQASGLAPSPRAWSGRHNKPSRGKAPRHSFNDKQPIVVAENIDDYRSAISVHVRDTDIVLEIGCHQGSSTVLMDNAGKRAVGVDKGEHVLKEGRRLHPQLALHDIDASDISALTHLSKKEGPFDVIFIDIGGGSLTSVASFWALIETYGKVLQPPPRVFIVKSFKLAELLHRCSLVQGL
jgi:hypothetical protein